MVLYLSRERHTLDPRTSASATNEAEQSLCKKPECVLFMRFFLRAGMHMLALKKPLSVHPVDNGYILFQEKVMATSTNMLETFYCVYG